MKACFLVAFLFLTAPAIGQQHSISVNYKPSLTYFGKQSQTFRHSHFASRKGDQTFNNAVNVLYDHRLSRKIGFTTGIEYAQLGQDINFNADSVAPRNNRKILHIELNYLRIPLTINYSILQRKNAELILYSGVSFGLAIERKDNYQYIILENILLPPAEKRYKEKDWAIPIGLNYKKELTANIFANMGFEYLVGVTDAFSEESFSKFGVLSQFENSKQKRLALQFGLGFHLAK